MDLTSSIDVGLGTLVVFVAGLLATIGAGRVFDVRIFRSIVLYAWHTAFGMTYVAFVIAYGGDAVQYYLRAIYGDAELSLGTEGVVFLTQFLVHDLHMSFVDTSLVFNVLGTIGLLGFDASLRAATAEKSTGYRRLASLIVFLPSASFWSSGIGKDSAAFMSVGLALWASLHLVRRTPAMVIAVALMLLVRPHIAALMVLGLTFSAAFDSRVSVGKRLLVGVLAALAAAALVPVALNYTVGENANAEEIEGYIESRQTQNFKGGGAVDISSMSVPEKLFTYLFRPVIFEANSITSLASGVENLLLISLAIAWLGALFKKRSRTVLPNQAFFWSYSLVAWVLLAATTANVGIAVRQKWMFTPMLIVAVLSAVGRPRRVQPRGAAAAIPPTFGKT